MKIWHKFIVRSFYIWHINKNTHPSLYKIDSSYSTNKIHNNGDNSDRIYSRDETFQTPTLIHRKWIGFNFKQQSITMFREIGLDFSTCSLFSFLSFCFYLSELLLNEQSMEETSLKNMLLMNQKNEIFNTA